MTEHERGDKGSLARRDDATERGAPRVPVVAIGGVVMAVGLVVISGWHAGAMTLVTLGLGSTKVAYNTAACLTLYGAAMVAVEFGHARWATGASSAGALLAALPLLQFVAGGALPVDGVFGTRLSARGADVRMALNAAICLTVLGVGFLLVTRRRSSLNKAIGVLLSWSTAALALIALGGVALDAPAAYAWLPVSPMAPPTAVCLLLLSIGLGLLYWDQPAYRLSWLPLPVGLVVLVSTAVVGQAVSAQQRAIGQRWLAVFAGNVAADAQRELQHQASALTSLSGEGFPGGEGAKRSLESFRESHPAFIALEVRAMDGSAARAGDAAVLGAVRQFIPPSDPGTGVVTRAHSIPGRNVSVITVSGGAGRDPVRVIGALDLRSVFAPLAAQQASYGRALTVADGATRIVVARGSVDVLEQQTVSVPIRVGDLQLTLSMTPSGVGPVALLQNPGTSTLVLVLGGVLGSSLSLLVWFAQRAARSRDLLKEDNQRRQRLETELRTTYDALLGAQQILAERTRALERSNHELEQFAYVASHDLQEPLRMVSSYTQLLARRYSGQLDDQAHEFIGFAVDGAQRMQRLISDLLAYSRLGTRGATRQATDTDDVVSQALANLHVAISESGALIEREPLPRTHGNEGQLVQLFQNLIGNAIKFRGGESPRVRVSGVRIAPGTVQFAVSDNGIGIDPSHAERIFVIFQRLHGKGTYPGTGIGLSICKKIVERHGGRIWMESQLGQGATFYFTLPEAGTGEPGHSTLENAA